MNTNELLADWARLRLDDIPFDAIVDIADLSEGVNVKWVEDGRWRQRKVVADFHTFANEVLGIALARTSAELLGHLRNLANEVKPEMEGAHPEYVNGINDAWRVFNDLLLAMLEP